MAEDLVTPAGDGLLGRGGEAEQHVAQPFLGEPPGLRRAGEVEGARAVVQERGVGDAGDRAHRGVALVAGRADRVEALALLAQPAGGDVEQPAGELDLEELATSGARERRARPHGQPGITAAARGERGNRLDEVRLNCVAAHKADYVAMNRVASRGLPELAHCPSGPLYLTVINDDLSDGTTVSIMRPSTTKE